MRTRHQNRWMRLFQYGMLILSGLAVIYMMRKVVISANDVLSHAYVGYYAATRLMVDDGWGPEAYDNTWFIHYVRSLTEGQVGEIIGPNLPTMALVAYPSALFQLPLARMLWTGENVILLGLGITFLFASIRPILDRWFYLLVIAFSLFFPPLVRNIELGQAYILVFCLLTIVLYGIKTEKDWLAGLGLAMAFMLKSAGVFLWFIPLLNQKWRVLVWSAGIAILIGLITLPRIGLDTWAAYPYVLMGINSDPVLTATAYQSIPGLLNHLFQYHEVWSPAPLLQAPLVAQIFVYGISIVSLGYTLYRIRNAPEHLQIAALLTLNTLLVPLVEEHQLVLMLIPITILAADLVYHLPDWQVNLPFTCLFLTGVALLTLPIPYKSPTINIGWLSLLAYPRLYGGWIIWWLTIKALPEYWEKNRNISHSKR